MGKVRGKKEVRKTHGGAKVRGVDNTVGKISADISAICLGPPRSKILKKTGGASSSTISVNFASRINSQNKQKKKVTFCKNLIAEELKETSAEGEDAKHYFKVIHPSAIGRKGDDRRATTSRVNSLIPGDDLLLSTSAQGLRKIIKKGVRNKKIRIKARKETFKKKMELIKINKDELQKAKQRQQTVIVGDMHPMLESLPSFEMEDMDSANRQTELTKVKDEEMKSVPKKNKFSVKKTQNAIMDSLKFFEAAGVGKTATGLSAN